MSMSAARFRIIAPGDLPNYHDLANDIAVAAWPEFMLDDPIIKDAVYTSNPTFGWCTCYEPKILSFHPAGRIKQIPRLCARTGAWIMARVYVARHGRHGKLA